MVQPSSRHGASPFRSLATLPEGSGEAYDRVAYHRYRIRFIARERVSTPPERLPNMLRGAFEIAFRRLVCHDIDLDCSACALRAGCTYPPLFRPSPPLGALRLSKQSDLPRPFVFEPPLDERPGLGEGEHLDVGLTLFGVANRALPYIVLALRVVAERGLGRSRGRLELQEVVALTPSGARLAYDPPRATVSLVDAPFRLPDLVQPGDVAATAVRVRFLTPTTLKRDGKLVQQPAFSDLVRRARDRLSAMAAFFGDGPLDIDFTAIGQAAEAVQTSRVSTRWAHRTRRSSRNGASHETSGFIGDAVFSGEIGPFMPLLRAAEALHVGKYAVWGNGRVEVTGDCGRHT